MNTKDDVLNNKEEFLWPVNMINRLLQKEKEETSVRRMTVSSSFTLVWMLFQIDSIGCSGHSIGCSCLEGLLFVLSCLVCSHSGWGNCVILLYSCYKEFEENCSFGKTGLAVDNGNTLHNECIGINQLHLPYTRYYHEDCVF